MCHVFESRPFFGRFATVPRGTDKFSGDRKAGLTLALRNPCRSDSPSDFAGDVGRERERESWRVEEEQRERENSDWSATTATRPPSPRSSPSSPSSSTLMGIAIGPEDSILIYPGPTGRAELIVDNNNAALKPSLRVLARTACKVPCINMVSAKVTNSHGGYCYVNFA